MQVRIRTNSVEFEFAPNSHEFVEPLEFEFEPKFLEIFCNHLEVHPFHPGGPVGGGIILRVGHIGMTSWEFVFNCDKGMTLSEFVLNCDVINDIHDQE